MNVNPEIIKLKKVTGLNVYPDKMPDDRNDEMFIVFAYEGEYGTHFGDNEVLADEAQIQVSLYTPPKYDYISLKEQIREYLETLGIITNIRSYLDDYSVLGNQILQIRHTVFNVEITKWRIRE